MLTVDAGLIYANGYMISLIQKGGNSPCNEIRFENPWNPFGG